MEYFNFSGNEKVKNIISNLIATKRIPHAIIIEGEQGLGKRTLARYTAMCLLCRNYDGKPCLDCPQCSKVINHSHPDVYEYTPSGSARSFSVKKVREIRDDAFIIPNEADCKIYILAECQCMSDQAQNAILKILEEPPSYAVFILTVDSKSALLDTVLSRSVVISLEGCDADSGAKYICSKDNSVSFVDAKNAVSAWNGNIGKAIDSLTQGKLSGVTSAACKICEALTNENEYDLLVACSVFEKDRDFLVNVMQFMKTIFRDALFYNETGGLLSGQGDIAESLSSRLTRKSLVRLINICDDIRVDALKNGNNAILITKVCYELRRALCR